MSWAFNMGTMLKRKQLCDRMDKVIAKITNPELKNSLIKTRDEYWNKIGELNKPDYTNEDYMQIQQEHGHMDRLLCKMEKITEHIMVLAEGVPVKHILRCKYPGFEFREEIDAFQVGIPYEDAYRDKLNVHIDKILAKQNLEKLMDVKYRDYEIDPKGHFIYSDVLHKISEKRPWDYEVEIKLDDIGQNGDILSTEKVDIADFFKRNPEYLQKPYMLQVANDYISISIRQFISDSCWQFELYNDAESAKKFYGRFKLHNSGCFPVYDFQLYNYDYIDYGIAHGLDNPENWPSPQKDGTWVDYRGKIMYPRIFFGLKDYKSDDDIWVLDGSDMKFWFNEDNANCYIESDNNEHVSAYHGYMPNMKEIRDKCPIKFKPSDTPEKINAKIQAFFMKQYKIVRQIPAKHVLYCDYPGLEFRSELDASDMRSSYKEDDYAFYREELEEYIFNELNEQGIEKLLNAHYTEDDVDPKGCLTYYEVKNAMQGYPPHNEKVKIYLDTVNKRGKVIKSEELHIMDFFVYDPEHFQEGGMWDATDEYVEASLRKFVHVSDWHFALQKGTRLIEDIKQWPSPNKDGLWTDKNGDEMHPYIWFGSKDSSVNIENELWNINNTKFWFAKDPSWDILGFCNDEDYNSYNGFVPDVDAIRKSCPIVLKADDTPESIKEKAQAFCMEQYRKAHS